ncbi:MAG: hypothetical protein WCX48_09005 [Bacteroidales bacterium]
MNNFDIPTLEQAVDRYPWFSLARMELFKKVCELGEEQKLACLSKVAAYLYSRERLYEISQVVQNKELPVTGSSVPDNASDTKETSRPSEEIAFEIETDPLNIIKSPKIVLAGGDYFNRTDFEKLELDTTKPLDKFIVEKPTLLRSNPALVKNETDSPLETEVEESFEDSGFYTETLAKIYTEQGFYKRALEVYAKLILLFPEKSSYFATLVQDLKSKHNQ